LVHSGDFVSVVKFTKNDYKTSTSGITWGSSGAKASRLSDVSGVQPRYKESTTLGGADTAAPFNLSRQWPGLELLVKRFNSETWSVRRTLRTL